MKDKEIGGYIELDRYDLPMLHETGIALNCGRNCLRYLITVKKIRKIALPYFLCDSIKDVCIEEGVNIRYYHIDENFCPFSIELARDEWMYFVNYYGQFSISQIERYRNLYGERFIVDNAQAYFDMPYYGTNTLYTCRKFFGVPDGAILYTDDQELTGIELEQDESHRRMGFILGRYERAASEFYDMYAKNNDFFSQETVKRMSKLTRNLLHGINYDMVKNRRTQNYDYLYEKFKTQNRLKLKKIKGAFAYPLYLENGFLIRKKLIERKIYIPTLWPNVLLDKGVSNLEYIYARNILPLPCDQRYGWEDMERIYKAIEQVISLSGKEGLNV